ncbi:MAG: PD40 domain-containing protein [Armatimonadetes bacterium]|nr:PD40 domain-containing protein [Armatimonadota bacterium]
MLTFLAPMLLAQTQDSVLVGDNPKEPHLRNVRQLTFGGQNAEAYWSFDGKQIVYQTRQPEWPDEQIVVMNADGSGKRLLSTGLGRCTCSYFTPDGKWLYFSSTHDRNKGAQTPVDHSKGYVWMVNPQFSIYRVRADGSGLTKVIDKNAYVAETTIDPGGKYMTWTSNFEGDLEIYRSDLNGGNVKRLTRNVGYDGGPFVSWDGKKIVYRRYDLKTQTEVDDYRKLLAENLVRPSKLEVYMMDADGKNPRRVTSLNCASFAPFLSPDNQWIIFCSNFGDKKGREFDLWRIRVDGTDLERITRSPEFDGFPMFSRDGKHLVFASNRNGKVRGETNVFVADWIE